MSRLLRRTAEKELCVCVHWQVDGRIVKHVERAPENDIYVRIPHRVLKPVPDHVQAPDSVFFCTCVSGVTGGSLRASYVHVNCAGDLPLHTGCPLPDAQERLERFYEQTFWSNDQVFLCLCAGIALAKRGENIDRCFFGRSRSKKALAQASLLVPVVIRCAFSMKDPRTSVPSDSMCQMVHRWRMCRLSAH